SPAEARRRFEARLERAPLAGEAVPLAAALSRVIAADVIAPIDTPPFDRANVDGFAVRAADTLGAGPGAPKRLMLNREVIACGIAPALQVTPGTATAIATGGVIPPGGVYDSNGAIIAAAVVESGGEAVPFGAVADDPSALERAMRDALSSCDMVVLSGGTSKGAGDLSHQVVSRLGSPGILVHGVAL